MVSENIYQCNECTEAYQYPDEKKRDCKDTDCKREEFQIVDQNNGKCQKCEGYNYPNVIGKKCDKMDEAACSVGKHQYLIFDVLTKNFKCEECIDSLYTHPKLDKRSCEDKGCKLELY